MNFIANGKLHLNGKVYEIVQSRTPEQYESEDKPNLARHMRSNNATIDMYVKLGRKFYTVSQFTDNRYSKVVFLFAE